MLGCVSLGAACRAAIVAIDEDAAALELSETTALDISVPILVDVERMEIPVIPALDGSVTKLVELAMMEVSVVALSVTKPIVVEIISVVSSICGTLLTKWLAAWVVIGSVPFSSR